MRLEGKEEGATSPWALQRLSKKREREGGREGAAAVFPWGVEKKVKKEEKGEKAEAQKGASVAAQVEEKLEKKAAAQEKKDEEDGVLGAGGGNLCLYLQRRKW